MIMYNICKDCPQFHEYDETEWECKLITGWVMDRDYDLFGEGQVLNVEHVLRNCDNSIMIQVIAVEKL